MRTRAKQLAVGLADTAVGRRIFLRRSRELVPVFMLHRFQSAGRSQDYGAREVGYLRALDYEASITSEPGYCALGKDADARFHLRRFSFPDNLLDFKDIVLQLQRLRARVGLASRP